MLLRSTLSHYAWLWLRMLVERPLNECGAILGRMPIYVLMRYLADVQIFLGVQLSYVPLKL